MASSILCMTFDCADPELLAGFWGAALGYERMDTGDGNVAITSQDGSGVPIWFIVVPEPKTTKNRFHLDLQCDDMNAEVARLLELGATVLWVHNGVRQSWTTLADPEGNEFCVG